MGFVVVKALEGSFNIAGHGEVNVAIGIVPVKGHATELGACPVDSDGVFFLEDGYEMVGMFFAHIFDPKVVHYEAEGDGTSGVGEKARDLVRLDIAMGFEVGDKGIIGDSASLGEAIHAFADFNVDKTLFINNGCEIVLVNDWLWDDRDVDTHVFVTCHGIVEVEILDVHAHEFGIRGADDTVEEDLGCGDAGCFGADVMGVVNEVAANSVANAPWVSFEGSVRCHNSEVSGFATFGNGRAWDEEHGVSSFGVFVALGQASKFLAVGIFPEGASTAVAQGGVFGQFTCVWIDSFIGMFNRGNVWLQMLEEPCKGLGIKRAIGLQGGGWQVDCLKGCSPRMKTWAASKSGGYDGRLALGKRPGSICEGFRGHPLSWARLGHPQKWCSRGGDWLGSRGIREGGWWAGDVAGWGSALKE